MQSTTSTTKKKSYKELLFLQLKNKKSRKAYMESHIRNGISFQIRTMRNNKKRKLSQEALGRLAGMKQEAICRLENPNYEGYTLKTLKDIAAAFDVALIVRFASFSELVKWDLNLSSDTLNIPSYDDDSYFQENFEIASTEGYKIKTGTPDNQVIDFNKIRANRPEKTVFNSVNTIPDGMQKVAASNTIPDGDGMQKIAL